MEQQKVENLKPLDKWINTLTEISNEMRKNWAEGSYPHQVLTTGEKYSGQTNDCKLKYFCVNHPYDVRSNEKISEDIELLEKLIDGYKTVKMEFLKRLKAYLKRYGLTKVESWSYLVD